MRWRWLLGVPLVSLTSCGVLLGGAAHSMAEDSFTAAREAIGQEIKAHSESFLADSAMLAPLPLFSARAGQDAGALLVQKLPFPTGPHTYPEVFDPTLRKALDAVGPRRWPADAIDVDVSDVDTRWMAELARFGAWDPYASSAVQAMRPLALHRVPLPSMQEAIRWSKVRLLQGLRGDLARAGREVEELARLLASSEIRVAELVALSCLRIARRTWEHARQAGIDAGGWEPPAYEVLDAYQRVHTAMLAYVDIHADPAVADPVLSDPRTTVGRCAALQDAGAFALGIEPVTGALFQSAVTRAKNLLNDNAGRCRFTALAGAWRSPEQRALRTGVDALCDAAEFGSADCIVSGALSKVPGVRDLAVEAFATVDPRSAFQGYARRP